MVRWDAEVGKTEMKVPHTLTALARQSPYAWYWTNYRSIRFMAYAMIPGYFVMRGFSNAVCGESNTKVWMDKWHQKALKIYYGRHRKSAQQKLDEAKKGNFGH